MNYVPRQPGPPHLQRAVEVMFSLSDYTPEHSTERIVPNGRISLVIELDGRERHIYDNQTGESRQICRGAWVSGVQSSYLTIGDTRPGTRLAAVQFSPGWAMPLLHCTLNDLNDRVAPAEEIFGASIVNLRQGLVDLADGEAVTARIEQWLLDRYDSNLEPPTVVSRVVDRLQSNPGGVSLTRLVETEGSISYKHFVSLFRKHVGSTPKAMQRILRFYRVFERIQNEPIVDWAGLSLELGFSDQAHFIRDFREFSGFRPQRFVEAGHDRINFFPDDHPR